jgi:hypothetical protein
LYERYKLVVKQREELVKSTHPAKAAETVVDRG